MSKSPWNEYVNVSPQVLTREWLNAMLEKVTIDGDHASQEVAERALAWSKLDLDYDAMTHEEWVCMATCQVAVFVHPNVYERAKVIIEKYRRDNRA